MAKAAGRPLALQRDHRGQKKAARLCSGRLILQQQR
jgi:hypothetical protein